MEKQVKININGKECYCDKEISLLLLRNDTKIENLQWQVDTLKENNKDYLDRIVKAIEYINKCIFYHDGYIYPDEAKIVKMILNGEWKDFGEDNGKV